MRCGHCPAPTGELCRGEEFPALCGYVDVTSSDHRPEYARILVADDVQVTDADRAMMAARAEFDPDFIAVGGCGC